MFRVNSQSFQYKKDLQAIFEALPDAERYTLLGVKGHSASPSKIQPLTSVSSNEATSAVVDAPGGQLAERTTNHDGDENRTIPKAGRLKAAIDPGKTVEKAAKVGLSIFAAYHYRLFIEGERADR
jgi:hypothetical protein